MKCIVWLLCCVVTVTTAQCIGVTVGLDGSPAVPDYGRIHTSVGASRSLFCNSTLGGTGIGFWTLPDGSVVQGGDGNVVETDGSVAILGPLSPGIYQCTIQDASDNRCVFTIYILPITIIPSSNASCSILTTSPLVVESLATVCGVAPTTVTCTDTALTREVMRNILSTESPYCTEVLVQFEPSSLSVSSSCSISDGLATVVKQCPLNLTPDSPPASSVNQVYSSATTSVVANFGQAILASSNFLMPLYCQSADDSVMVQWELPTRHRIQDGETNGSASAFLIGSSLGLALRSSATEGVYSCVVAGDVVSSIYVTNSFKAPALSGFQACEFRQYVPSLILNVLVTTTDGPPTSVSCASSDGIVMDSDLVSMVSDYLLPSYSLGVTFEVSPVPDTYTCNISNDHGSTNVSCEVLASSLCVPYGVVGGRVQESPTSADVSWRTVPGATGYIVTVTGSDGSSTAMIVTDPSTTVTGLDVSTSYSITVQAISDNLSDSPRLPSPASYPVTIATADANSRCRPGRGYSVELTFTSDRRFGMCDCSSVTSDMLQSILMETNGLIDTTKCSNPLFIPDTFNCSDAKAKRRKGKYKTRSSSGNNRRQTRTVSGVVVCDTCEEMSHMRGRYVHRYRWWQHWPRNRRWKKSESHILGVVPNAVSLCEPAVSFEVARVSEKEGNLYCGSTVVNDDATCDCPASCL